jgi:hypothetical protein
MIGPTRVASAAGVDRPMRGATGPARGVPRRGSRCAGLVTRAGTGTIPAATSDDANGAPRRMRTMHSRRETQLAGAPFRALAGRGQSGAAGRA